MDTITSPHRIRIGAVSYLNTKPLVYGLAERAREAELVYDLPSRLADDLAAGKLDIALIPSIEFFQDSTYTIVSNACIGCRGPVLSVKLLSRVPLPEIRTLALDEGSRTSAALVRILLRERFNLLPALLPLPIGVDAEDVKADAVLVIGDRAIHAQHEPFVAAWDLGEEWVRWSGLPFVFAMWVARAGVDLHGLDLALAEARDAGVAHLPEIAAREAAAVNLPVATCWSYLRDNLYFYLGAREWQGLGLYYQHAARLGLAPAGLELPEPHALVGGG